MPVKQLGYLIFECQPNVLEQMIILYRDIFRADVATDAKGRACVRLDGRAFRIRLDPGPANRLAAIGWDVTEGDLSSLAAGVAGAGYAVTSAPSELAQDRAALSVLQFMDADEFANELYVDGPFEPDEDLNARFVCGEQPNGVFGLGHLVQIVGDRRRAQSFYTDVLGFGLSDQITWPAADLYFLHCNQRHHTIALSAEGLGLKAGMIHHLMIEAKSREAVDQAYAAVREKGFKVLMTIGQHTNDQVYSFYILAPAGFGIEFGFDGVVVEDPATWQFARYDAPSSWGHELQV